MYEVFEDEVFKGATPRIFTVESVGEDNGRVFVWSKVGWFERIQSDTSGAVEFSPVGVETEAELRQWIFQDELGELTEIDDDFAAEVRDEFLEQTPLYPEAPELSDEPLEDSPH